VPAPARAPRRVVEAPRDAARAPIPPDRLWALLPVAAFAYGLSYSWGRWGEIVIDWGRELQVARRIATGDVLYADLHYWYGPLAPYVNALLFAAFGAHTRVLQTAGLVSAVLMTIVLWALARRLGGAIAAALVATAFVSLCAFGHYYLNDIFNWATPYAYPATYGMLCATGSLYALVRHLEHGGARWLVASQVLLALSILSKLEPAFAAILAHCAFVSTSVVMGRGARGRLVAGYAAVAGAVGIVTGAFTLETGVEGYQTSILSQLNQRNLQPILRYMGLGDWRDAAGAMMRSALRIGACLLAPVVARRLATPLGRAAAIVISLSVPIAAFHDAAPEQALRALPLVALAAFVDAVLRFVRHRDARRTVAAEVVLWSFAVGALARLPLAAGAHHYGFYLIPVPLAAMVLLWFRRVPDRSFGTVAAASLVATLAWTHTAASAAMYARHTAHVVTPSADLRLLDDAGGVPVGTIYAETIARLREYPAATTVLAAPEGAGLSFVAGLSLWGNDFAYAPAEMGPEADARLRAALERRPPDLVVLLNLLDLRHYGSLGFGRDYATASVAFIQQHYEVDRTFAGNGVVIARRRTLAH
jgi:hypothetical protein